MTLLFIKMEELWQPYWSQKRFLAGYHILWPYISSNQQGLDLPKHWLQTPSFKASQDLSSLVSVDALHKAFSINQVHKEATWVTNSPVLNKSRHLRSTCLLFLSSIWKTPCLGNKFVHSHKHFEKSFRCVLIFAWYSMYEAVHYSIHTWMCALSCLDGSPE